MCVFHILRFDHFRSVRSVVGHGGGRFVVAVSLQTRLAFAAFPAFPLGESPPRSLACGAGTRQKSCPRSFISFSPDLGGLELVKNE